MLGRAVALQSGDEDHAELAAAIRLQFRASAAVLRSHVISGAEDQLDRIMLAASQETPLAFALTTLQHELAGLRQTLEEWTTPARLHVPPRSL